MDLDNHNQSTGIPHVYTILFFIIILAAAATWFVPSGQYVRHVGEFGSVIVPNTYHHVEGQSFGFMQTLSTIYRGMISSGETVFFIFIAFASISVIVATGAFHDIISKVLTYFGGPRRILIIPTFITIIGMLSSSTAVFEEMFSFVPLFVAVAMAMRYDALVGMAIVSLGIGLGYSGSFLNPFTVGVAQHLAELPPFSGAQYRIFCHIVMILVASGYVMVYAMRVAHDPSRSLMPNHEPPSQSSTSFGSDELGPRHVAVLLIMVAGVGAIIVGVRMYGWFFEQISAVYLLMGISSGLVMGWSPDRIAHKWADSACLITPVCLKVALAKGIVLILDEAKIMDTIINVLAMPLLAMPRWVAAEAMLVVQTILNFFIPSGAGQAVVSMPLMIPLADLIGMSRQTAILAFQFGDGLSNLLWLTGSMPIICRFARVPPRRWLRFFIPLFFMIYVVQMFCIAGALAIGYH